MGLLPARLSIQTAKDSQREARTVQTSSRDLDFIQYRQARSKTYKQRQADSQNGNRVTGDYRVQHVHTGTDCVGGELDCTSTDRYLAVAARRTNRQREGAHNCKEAIGSRRRIPVENTSGVDFCVLFKLLEFTSMFVRSIRVRALRTIQGIDTRSGGRTGGDFIGGELLGARTLDHTNSNTQAGCRKVVKMRNTVNKENEVKTGNNVTGKHYEAGEAHRWRLRHG